MSVVIYLVIMCLVGVLVFYLLKDNKIDKQLKQEQLKYYKYFNNSIDEKEGNDDEKN